MNVILTVLIFAQLTTPYQTRIFLDADGRFVMYARYYGSEFISIDSVKTVAQYMHDGFSSRNRTFLLNELKKDLLQQGGNAISNVPNSPLFA